MIQVDIWQDDDAEDPRESESWATTMLFDHQRYTLGDPHPDWWEAEKADWRSWRDVEAAIRAHLRVIVLAPVYLMDHSGLTLSLDAERFRAQDYQAWDWGQIGFVFVTREQMDEALGVGLDLAWAEQAMRQEVAFYNGYLTGDIWGYTVRDGGEVIDSCGGYDGRAAAVEAAQQVIDAAAAGPAATLTAERGGQ